jgi:thiaminase (transcriptional activator TenA)
MERESPHLSDRLFEVGMPFIDRHERHPTVLGLTSGTLDERVARAWLEQDYLYLVEEIRVLARLAWLAPRAHQDHLIELAWRVIHEEIPNHEAMAAPFRPDLAHAQMGAACRAYAEWLIDAAADYGLGLVALLSGLWAYSTLGQRLSLPEEPRFCVWVASYQSPEFAPLARRFAAMVDESPIDPGKAVEVFLTGLEHGIEFWDAA